MRMTLSQYLDTRPVNASAFIGVDLQNDFGHTKGSLYVKGGEELVEVANQVAPFFGEGLVFWTKDCHPTDHCSFKENGGPWPVHCVKGKWGSQFLRGLNVLKDVDIVIPKGVDSAVDSYSAFFDNAKAKKTELEDILKQEGVTTILVMGLATDYCVKFTVLDALAFEWDLEVALYLPGCRGVEVKEADVKAAIDEMEAANAIIIEE